MKRRHPRTHQAAQTVFTACAVVFIVFSFVYLYVYQPDLLAQQQYFFSHGTTVYNAFLGAVVITVLLTFAGYVLWRLFKPHASCAVLVWLPPSYFLALLTSVRFGTDGGVEWEAQWHSMLVLLAGYIVLALLCRICAAFIAPRYKYRYRFSDLDSDSVVPSLSLGLFVLSCAFFLLSWCSNAGSVLHHELRVARLLHEGRSSEALATGVRDTSRRLSTLRVAAMLSRGTLADSLFSLPLTTGSSVLLPSACDTCFVLAPETCIYVHLLARPARRPVSTRRFLERVYGMDSLRRLRSRDMYLCSFLLDKDVDAFAENLSSSVYALHPDSLPRYYREALVLHGRMGRPPYIDYADEVMETNLEDFMRLKEDNGASPREKAYRVSRMFADTYWYYYFFNN